MFTSEFNELVEKHLTYFKSFYEDSISLPDDKWVKMFVVDSCFIVKFLVDVYGKKDEPDTFQGMNLMDKTTISVDDIKGDLLMYGNQIPFDIIEMVMASVSHAKLFKFLDRYIILV